MSIRMADIEKDCTKRCKDMEEIDATAFDIFRK